MTILGIDPGDTKSAAAIINGNDILDWCFLDNTDFPSWVLDKAALQPVIVCEMIASYGMSVGQSVFETCVFIGQLKQQFPAMHRATRVQIKTTICHSARAKDSNIRQALIDRWGKPGTAKAKGRTYGISGDIWAALAVATAWQQGVKPYSPNPGV